MEWMDPPFCAPVSETNPELAWRIFADDGVTILNRVSARACFIDYVCWQYMYYGVFPGNTNITAQLEPTDPMEPVEPPAPEPDPEPKE
jgi:hypothetical protein